MNNWRFSILILGLVAVFLTLLGRAITIMGFEGQFYRELSSGNHTKEEQIFADRGLIYDRYSTILVINSPEGRKYKYGPALASVLGYVSDRKGVAGIESQYNDILSGKNGKKLYEVDASGNKIRLLGSVDPVVGKGVTLNIDVNLQQEAFNLMKDQPGAVVVTNPNGGEILALVSSPGFDPANLEEALLSANRPLFNRAISGTYPPGSTFKLITSVGALEQKVITSETRFEDTGVLTIGEYKFPNWKWLKNGGVDGFIGVVEAIQKSNDIFFYQAGGKMGIDGITNWAGRFGLGKPLGVDLPGEAGGVVPNAVWRKDNNREWFLGDTYHLSIGQGVLLATPLQVNMWTAAMANDGKICVPRLVGNGGCKDLGIKKENLELVKKGMIAACASGGTAYPLFGMDVACKTGTAEFGDPKNRTHAWLTAYSPIKEPKIVVTVLVEGAGEGSDVAAPIVKSVLEKYFSYKQ